MNHDKVLNLDYYQGCYEYLARDIFPDEVVEMEFFNVLRGNRYLPRSSKEDVLSITVVGNVSVAR